MNKLSSHLLIVYVTTVTLSAIIIWILLVLLGPATFEFWDWTAQSWSAVGEFSVVVGILGVLLQIDGNRKRNRIDVDPYVRVDVGATNVTQGWQFDPPEPYYENDDLYTEMVFDGDDTDSIEISAWFRNYQENPLGFALAVNAQFSVRIDDPADDQPPYTYFLRPVILAYIERCKAARIGLLRAPKDLRIRVELVALNYQDIYDGKHRYTIDNEPNESAIHGRFVFEYGPDQGAISYPVAHGKSGSYVSVL